MKKKFRTVFNKLNNPNTWGRQDYQGESLSQNRNFRTDKSRPDELKNMGFVQRIMTKYVTGHKKRDFGNTLWRDLPNT